MYYYSHKLVNTRFKVFTAVLGCKFGCGCRCLYLSDKRRTRLDFWTLWSFNSEALRSVRTTGPLTKRHTVPTLQDLNSPKHRCDNFNPHHGLSSCTVTRNIYSHECITLIRGLTARTLRLAHSFVSRALVTCHRPFVFCLCSLVMRKVSRLHWSEDGGVWECAAC